MANVLTFCICQFQVQELYPQSAQVNVHAAMIVIQSLERDLDAFKRAVQTGSLVPLPEETVCSQPGSICICNFCWLRSVIFLAIYCWIAIASICQAS